MDKLNNYRIKVNTKREGNSIKILRKKIEFEVIGQDRAIRRLLRAVASYFSGLKDPRRPIGGFIFAGPTGVGKTFTAKVFARHFLGGHDWYRDYLTRIDCSVLNHDHEISRLTGAPPGYIGYKEPPLFSQEFIDAYHFDVKLGNDDGILGQRLKELQMVNVLFKGLVKSGSVQRSDPSRLWNRYLMNKPYCSVILFDEIEKAHPRIWNVLLQIMEEGEIQLGTGEKTSFADSVVILTTNIGQRDIHGLFKGGLGFKMPQTDIKDKQKDNQIYDIVKEGVKKTFPPELFKRLDLVVFRPLQDEDFEKILDNFLLEEHERLNGLIRRLSRRAINIEYTSKAQKFLLKEGVDIFYGVRTLRATIEKYIRAQIANGISSREIVPGDKILVDERDGKLVFLRQHRPRGQNAVKRPAVFENIDH